MQQPQVYGFSSNARRAARTAGLNPDEVVKPNPTGLGFIVQRPNGAGDGLDVPEALMVSAQERREAWEKNPPKAAPKTEPELAMAKPKTSKQRKGRDAKPGDKTALLISMLKSKTGATVDTLTKATGWLPHTLRARISGLAKPPHKLKVERERADGVTSYRIA
jgi:hypothetical protein